MNVVEFNGFYTLAQYTLGGVFIDTDLRAKILATVEERDLWMFTEDELAEIWTLSLLSYALSSELFYRAEFASFVSQRIEYFTTRLRRVLYREVETEK